MTLRIVSLLAAAGLCLVGARALAVIQCSYDDGVHLQITTTAGENVALTVSGGLLKVNGADPRNSGTPFTVSAANLTHLVVTGDGLGQTLDASGLSLASGIWPYGDCTLNGGGGDDVLVGAELPTAFDGGPGADTCQAGSTTDVFQLHAGEGPDSLTTLGGSNEVHVEGDDSNETYRLVRDGSAMVVSLGDPEIEHLRMTGGCLFLKLFLRGGDDAVTADSLTGLGITQLNVIPDGGKFTFDSSGIGVSSLLYLDATADDSVINGENCDLNYTADDAGETATLTASGTAVVLSRISPRPATISMTGVKALGLSGGESDDHLTVGKLAGTATHLVGYDGREGSNFLFAEEYADSMIVYTGRTAGSTEAHLPLYPPAICYHQASGAGGRQLRVDSVGATGRITDVGLGVVPLLSMGKAYYTIVTDRGNDVVEVMNLSSAGLKNVDLLLYEGDDTLILRDLGNQPGFRVTAEGYHHSSGDSLTLDASGRTYSLNQSGGKFTVGTAIVSFTDFENLEVINTPTPSPTPSPTASRTPSPTASPSPSLTPSATPSPSPSATAVPGPVWVVR